MSAQLSDLSPLEQTVREWLVKADNDIRSADALAKTRPPILDTAGYHSEQAAEKALKGLMLFHGLPLLKSHDLTLFVETLATAQPQIVFQRDAALYLTPFATLFRYPAGSGFNEPTPAEFQQAYRFAVDIVSCVHSLLPSHILPH
jgi:HEPN domain-containing protein